MPLIRIVITVAVFALASLTVTVLTIGALRWHEQSIASAKTPDPNALIGLRGFLAPITVQSYDESSNSIIAFMRSEALGQDVLVQIKFSDRTLIERRDAIVINGVIMGVGELTSATISDLEEGTRGFVRTFQDPEGRWLADYLVIGDPAPRP